MHFSAYKKSKDTADFFFLLFYRTFEYEYDNKTMNRDIRRIRYDLWQKSCEDHFLPHLWTGY